MSNVITQVQQDDGPDFNTVAYDGSSSIDANSKIHLHMRDADFTITRDELMGLPESILLCLFPNGVFLDSEGQVISNLTEDDIVFVDFEPECFRFIIDTFRQAQAELESSGLRDNLDGFVPQTQQEASVAILQSRPAIIVLREDLDYYVIPPVAGLNADQVRYLKLEVALKIKSDMLVFSGLGYDPSHPETEQTFGPAEKHLFEMLCSSGFEPNSIWGNRGMEPSKCIIQSLLLVRLQLKQQTPSPPESPALDPVRSNTSVTSRSRSRIANLASSASRAASRSLSRSKKQVDPVQTKLLLFWRKPARKCWWSNLSVEVDCSCLNLNQKTYDIKVHVRRVWTLELSVIGVK